MSFYHSTFQQGILRPNARDLQLLDIMADMKDSDVFLNRSY
jgi:hypothetical protein